MTPRLPGRCWWAPACLMMLLMAACSTDAQVTYTPPFVPFTLAVSVDQHGHVSVSASVSGTLVTEIGAFSVGGGVSSDLAKQNQGTVVDFRSGTTDNDYMIHTGRELHFEADGHIVETITQNLVIITVSPGTAFSIAVSGVHPPPAPKPDPNCRGTTHVVRLPVLDLGPLGNFDSVDDVRAKLRSICITSTVLKVIHGAAYHERGGQDEGQYTFEHNGNWRPWPAGSVQEVDIPCDRHMFFIFWHNYDYIDVSYDSYAFMGICPQWTGVPATARTTHASPQARPTSPAPSPLSAPTSLPSSTSLTAPDVRAVGTGRGDDVLQGFQRWLSEQPQHSSVKNYAWSSLVRREVFDHGKEDDLAYPDEDALVINHLFSRLREYLRLFGIEDGLARQPGVDTGSG